MATPQAEPNLDEIIAESRGRAMRYARIYTFPYWFLFLVILGILLAISILTNSVYSNIFGQLIEGVVMTIFVSATSYVTALCIAIVVGIIRSNPPDPPQSRQALSRALLRILRIGCSTCARSTSMSCAASPF